MKKEMRDVFLVVLAGFAVMCLLPAVYRIWLHYNPPSPTKPFSDVVREADGLRRERLMQTPPEKWSEFDRKTAPDVFEWLKARADTVLPWEWSEEAMKKDWKGYCRTWRRMLDRQVAALDKLSRVESDAMSDAAERAALEREGISCAMERVADIRSPRQPRDGDARYPVSITVGEVVPGRLWGWRLAKRKYTFADESSLLSFAGELERRVNLEWRPAAEAHEKIRDESKAAVAEIARAKGLLDELRRGIAEAGGKGYGTDRLPKDALATLLLSIAAEHGRQAKGASADPASGNRKM